MKVRGTHVVRVLLLAALATAVLPPAGAWWLNGRRVQRTQERAATVAAQLPPGSQAGVVCGPGRVDGPTDAWGNCFIVNDHWVHPTTDFEQHPKE